MMGDVAIGSGGVDSDREGCALVADLRSRGLQLRGGSLRGDRAACRRQLLPLQAYGLPPPPREPPQAPYTRPKGRSANERRARSATPMLAGLVCGFDSRRLHYLVQPCGFLSAPSGIEQRRGYAETRPLARDYPWCRRRTDGQEYRAHAPVAMWHRSVGRGVRPAIRIRRCGRCSLPRVSRLGVRRGSQPRARRPYCCD